MTLETWVKNTWLEKRGSDPDEIGRLLALADGRLEDYRRATAGKLSADVQLGLAYDVIRISATAALRAAGYRVVRGGGEHYRTIEALEFSIDPQKKRLIPTLDKLRKKRNTGSYDDFGLVSQGEADSCDRLGSKVKLFKLGNLRAVRIRQLLLRPRGRHDGEGRNSGREWCWQHRRPNGNLDIR